MYHGVPKLQKPGTMASGAGMPASMIFLLGIVESFSGVVLIVGVWVQFAALVLALVMVGAMYKKIVTWHVPFFAHNTTGWEFDAMLLAASIAILLTGGGVVRFL